LAAGRAEAYARSRLADRAVLALKGEFPHLTALDARSVFCPGEQCTVRDGDTLFFRDPGHLTNEGSRFVVRGLSAQLMVVLEQARTMEGGASCCGLD
jgi:hypothetical protein